MNCMCALTLCLQCGYLLSQISYIHLQLDVTAAILLPDAVSLKDLIHHVWILQPPWKHFTIHSITRDLKL